MPLSEREASPVRCAVCRGTGVCQACAYASDRHGCLACFYSRRCPTCGGTGVRLIGRRF